MTTTKPTGTKTERLARERFLKSIRHLNNDDMLDQYLGYNIPDAWATLEKEIDVTEKRVKITLRLDESVVKFYRGMGNGYQARINRILATYAQLKISNLKEHNAYIEKHDPTLMAF